MLTQARLKEFLSYAPETGVFTRIKRAGSSGPVGRVSKTPHKDGYLTSSIDGRDHLQHRLAWLYVHGEFPSADIDHINGERDDNRLCNLRAAERFENHQNKGMQSNNASGHIGVSWRANRGHWKAQITVRGKHHYLGGFKHLADAVTAYEAAKARLHMFQPTSRKYNSSSNI